MIDVKILRAMAAAGASLETILSAIEADQATEQERLERRRTQTAERVRRFREKRKPDRGAVTLGNASNALHALHEENHNKINGCNEPVTRYTQESLILSSSSKTQSPNKDSRGFEKFWEPYPRKLGKKAAEKAYAKALKDGALPEEIAAGVRKTKFPSDPKYVPHPARWLNEGRWLDGSGNPHRDFMREFGI